MKTEQAIILTPKKVAANRKKVWGLCCFFACLFVFFFKYEEKHGGKEGVEAGENERQDEVLGLSKNVKCEGKTRETQSFQEKNLIFESHRKRHKKAVNKHDEKKIYFPPSGKLKSKAGEEHDISVVTNYSASQYPVKTNSFSDHSSIP